MQKNMKVKTNIIQRLFGQGDQPTPAPEVVPASEPAKTSNVHNSYYVATPHGFVQKKPPSEDSPLPYKLTSDMRYATSFGCFAHADDYGKNIVMPNNRPNKQYYAIVQPSPS